MTDGGHNSFAIGQYILQKAMDFFQQEFKTKSKNWEEL
jgi:hypothetical protein